MHAEGTFITPTLRLVRPLGAGGMGAVWLAEHAGLRTKVVVKFMSEELARHPEAVARFSREAAAASQVASPHVVQMIDYGVASDGAPYIAMEYLEGQDLGHRLALQPIMPPREIAMVLAQAAKALSRAHARGVIHRDIKPDNIFLADIGGGEAFVKVLDFGIAKSFGPESVGATRTGAMLGTPLYMSPEQVMGARNIDHRTDIWALGVIAFEALTGKRPFDGETVGSISIAICHGPLPTPSRASASLPRGFDAWFARACARDPAARFGNAIELADEFERIAGGTKRVLIITTNDEATVIVTPGARVETSTDALPTQVVAAPLPVHPSTIGAGVSVRTASVGRRRPVLLFAVLALIAVAAAAVGVIASARRGASRATTTTSSETPSPTSSSATTEVTIPLVAPIETIAAPTAPASSSTAAIVPSAPKAVATAMPATRPTTGVSAASAPSSTHSVAIPSQPKKPSTDDPNIY